MATEGATSISELNPILPDNVNDPVGEADDHLRMTKLVLQNTFVDQPSDAWDDAAPLDYGPRQINGWEGRISANEAAVAGLPGTYAPLTHFAPNVTYPNAANVLYAGGRRVTSTTDGATVRSPTATDLLLNFEIGATTVGNIGALDTGRLTLENQVLGAQVRMSATGAGGLQIGYNYTPDGAADIRYAGEIALISAQHGATVRDPVSTETAPELEFQANDATPQARILCEPNQTKLRGEVNSQTIRIDSLSSAGARRVMADFDPDNGVHLNYQGSPTFENWAGGASVFRSDSADTAEIRGRSGDNTTTLWRLRRSDGLGLYLQGEVNGELLRLQARKTNGTAAPILEADPDGITDLYAAGVMRCRVVDGPDEAVAGLNVTGSVRVSEDPTQTNHATRKDYVDGEITALGISSGANYMIVDGKIHAWGEDNTPSAGSSPQSFGVTFGSAPIVTVSTEFTVYPSASMVVGHSNVTTTGFNIVSNDASNVIAYTWHAMGDAP